jgi:hypothetical protein
MWRRCLRLARMGLVIFSLIACAALAALWVESYRHWYRVAHQEVRESQSQWRSSRWGASLDPSCVYLWKEGEQPRMKTEIFPGPQGEVREIPVPRPAEGWQLNAGVADVSWDSGFSPGDVRWRFARVTWVVSTVPGPRRLLVLPLWPLVLLAGVGPVAWAAGGIARRQARRRAAAGLCPACGYDLRASSGRCPECGWGRGDRPAISGGGGGGWSRWGWAIVGVACVVAAAAGAMLGGIALWGPQVSGATGPYGGPVP